MKPFEAYQIYNAVQLHFNGDYDCFKYRFKTRVNENSFYKRNDRYFFAKLAKHYDQQELIDFLGSQCSGGSLPYVADLFTDDSDKAYLKWQKNMQSFTFFFTNQMSYLKDKYGSFDSLFVVTDLHPPIIEEWLQGEIESETVVALDQLLGFVNKINSKDILLWPNKQKFLLNYSPFVKVDHDKVKKVIMDLFTS